MSGAWVACSTFCSHDGHLPAWPWYGESCRFVRLCQNITDSHQALVLNRVNVYASSRQRIVLTWEKRFALRIIPILLFITQIRHLLQALQCQTSPDFSSLRYGTPGKSILLDWNKSGGWLYKISSALLFGTTDRRACAAVGLGQPSPNARAPYGSFPYFGQHFCGFVCPI